MNDKTASHLPHSPSVLPSSPEALALTRANRGSFAEFAQRPPAAQAPRGPQKPKASDYPDLSVIVLGTQNRGRKEFRVGLVSGRDFAEGLRLPSGELNRDVAHRCFGQSPVYTERQAEAAAHTLYEAKFEEFKQHSYGAHLKNNTRGDEGREVIEDLSALETLKRISGIKIFHQPCPWPA